MVPGLGTDSIFFNEYALICLSDVQISLYWYIRLKWLTIMYFLNVFKCFYFSPCLAYEPMSCYHIFIILKFSYVLTILYYKCTHKPTLIYVCYWLYTTKYTPIANAKQTLRKDKYMNGRLSVNWKPSMDCRT